jgi:hypothetical protein
MFTLHIEHEIHDFDAWRAAFDRDPAHRHDAGVRHYRLSRPIDDRNYVLIDLDFDSAREAETFAGAMRKVWQSPAAAPALRGAPRTRIVETVETADL